MVRTHGKVDGNQGEIVDAIRAANYSCTSSASLSKGFPDVIVGVGPFNLILEIKSR